MKKTILILTILCFGFSSQAQKVKEKDILGTWKLILNIEEAIKEEADDADTMLEEVFINVISGFISGIIDDIDIYFEFKENNKLKITLNTDEESETEYGKWFINKRGYLQIEDVDDNDIVNDDEWKLIDGILVTDDYEDDKDVYMAKVD
ncbi:MAG: hypothetical protein GDA51_10085 [Ekhidna sp.]|nr:hypothetical protein [Ekhidna sp.]MBC6410690.1 hypothetical protein [Ekhidna sp.]MBC6426794.1 hypothetical protein [Ekhidna sp.]